MANQHGASGVHGALRRLRHRSAAGGGRFRGGAQASGRGKPGRHEGHNRSQVFLKPAVMLLFGIAEPGSSTEVVTFSGPATVCSMLSLLCHWLSRFDELAPAENV